MSVIDLEIPSIINNQSINYTKETAFSEKVAVSLFLIASYFTDPICKMHQYYRQIAIVDHLHPEASDLSNLIKKVSFCAGIVLMGILAFFTTIPGICLRYLAACLQKQPYVSIDENTEAKVLSPNRSFTLFSWNTCCVAGGYPITDGGVLPWFERIDKIVDKIIEKDADVNCIYETFDFRSPMYLYGQLKDKGYKQFYFNIGPKTVGVSSGIFVASKYKITNPEFTQFSEEILVGRTKNAAKGIFSFDLESNGVDFAKIHATHLQHSEEPEHPTDEEIEARLKQMQIIVEKVKKIKDRCVVVTGDLNLDDDEYNQSYWAKYFDKGELSEFDKKTWDGDAFCATLMGKKVSGPLNLDHTMIVKKVEKNIKTTLVDVGFDASTLTTSALSDHRGLLSRIHV